MTDACCKLSRPHLGAVQQAVTCAPPQQISIHVQLCAVSPAGCMQGLSYSTTAGDEVEDLFLLLAYIKVLSLQLSTCGCSHTTRHVRSCNLCPSVAAETHCLGGTCRLLGKGCEDMYCRCGCVLQEAHPDIQAVASGAIASDYQRLRVESVSVNKCMHARICCAAVLVILTYGKGQVSESVCCHIWYVSPVECFVSCVATRGLQTMTLLPITLCCRCAPA